MELIAHGFTNSATLVSMLHGHLPSFPVETSISVESAVITVVKASDLR